MCTGTILQNPAERMRGLSLAGWTVPHCAMRPRVACADAMVGPPNDTQMLRKVIIVGGAVALAAAASYALIVVPRQAERQASAAHGAMIYAANCAGCHGDRLQGQADWKHVNAQGRLPAPPLDGTGHGWRHSNAELFHMVKFSVLDQAGPDYQTDMPAFAGKLSDPDIADVLAYIHAQWPSGIQAAQSFLNPDHAGMPDHIDGDWRLPADCEEPVRRGKIPVADSGKAVDPQSRQTAKPE
jgi:mono/diheme cytochrome c family protein